MANILREVYANGQYSTSSSAATTGTPMPSTLAPKVPNRGRSAVLKWMALAGTPPATGIARRETILRNRNEPTYLDSATLLRDRSAKSFVVPPLGGSLAMIARSRLKAELQTEVALSTYLLGRNSGRNVAELFLALQQNLWVDRPCPWQRSRNNFP